MLFLANRSFWGVPLGEIWQVLSLSFPLYQSAGNPALYFLGVVSISEEQQIIQALNNILRVTGKIGVYLLKRALKAVLAKVLLALAPYWIALLTVIFFFGFVYFSVIMLPKYIAQASNSPGIVYNWGKGDIWTIDKDIQLIDKYKELDSNWLNRYRSFDTLAYQKPDSVGGSNPNKNATVSDIWGEYMGSTRIDPISQSEGSKYDGIFQKAASKYGLDVRLLKALAWAESSFNPRAVSSQKCMGLMQLSPDKIKEYGIKDPFNPEENVDGGARYLKYLLDTFKNIELAVAAYNAGPNAVSEALSAAALVYPAGPVVSVMFALVELGRLYPETQAHVRKVMMAYAGSAVILRPESGSNIVAERDQARPYSVPWVLMASLDRVLGDPIVHGKHGLETMGKGRIPRPEAHFNELEPKLKWKDFELYYYRKWIEVYYEKGSDGKPVRKTRTCTEEYRHNVKLLTFADTYEAKYTHNWSEKGKTIERGREAEVREGVDYTKVIVPELIDVQREGPYYERLRKILAARGLTRDSELELVLRIAMNMDDNFYINANLTSSLLEISEGTEGFGYAGGTGELDWPVRGPITSKFGQRIDPFTKMPAFHSGIDIACPRGAEIRAADKGLVIFVGDNSGYGKTIIINHGKYRTLYAHLLSYKVKPGDEVEKGQVIGLGDSTGKSTGNHLHFEVRTGEGKTGMIDPLKILP